MTGIEETIWIGLTWATLIVVIVVFTHKSTDYLDKE